MRKFDSSYQTKSQAEWLEKQRKLAAQPELAVTFAAIRSQRSLKLGEFYLHF